MQPRRQPYPKDLTTGSYDLIVLDVLRDGPAYVYELCRRITHQSRHHLQWHEGTLYHVLYHLEKQGLVTSQRRTGTTGHERRYYRLTERGRQAWRKRRAEWRAFTAAVNSVLRR
jgi:DNA-binding PadR family transcriptional regulator